MQESDTTAEAKQLSALDIPVAFALLTRLPLPRLPDHAFERQANSGWAFVFVGLVVAAFAGGIGWLGLQIGLPVIAAAGAVLAIQMIITGAMHEDGLADTTDGLWGGWTPERRLEIMKDSSIGTYGVLTLILSVGLRWSALAVLLPQGIGAILVAACLSRALLPALMAALPNARKAGLSHSVGVPGWNIAALALGFGIATSALLTGTGFLLPSLCAVLAVVGLAAVARAKIGGQTGDILGAAQQIAEITILLGFSIGVST